MVVDTAKRLVRFKLMRSPARKLIPLLLAQENSKLKANDFYNDSQPKSNIYEEQATRLKDGWIRMMN